MRRFIRRLAFQSTICAAGLVSWAFLSAEMAAAMPLKSAIQRAVNNNPQISEAKANREAIEFELDQAHGQYLPKIDLEGYAGWERRSGGITATGRNGEVLEGNIVLNQLLFDGFEVWADKHYQAARVDGASHRVYERAEFIALSVIREYVQVGLYNRVIAMEQKNLRKLRSYVSKVSRGLEGGTTSVADQQQATERVSAAQAQIEESKERRNQALIRFRNLVGEPMQNYVGVPPAARLPGNLTAAIEQAKHNNPTIKIAQADLDAAYGLYRKAESAFLPKVNLEARSRHGDDLDDINGRDSEQSVQIVARWNILNGGIDHANRQEQLRRMDEARARLRGAQRDVEEAVRLSWNRRVQQRARLATIRRQLNVVNQLIRSYDEQFRIGKRSLLDLLDTQNTKLNAQILLENARAAILFADYRVLASTGTLLEGLGIETPHQTIAYARDLRRVHFRPTPEEGTLDRWEPRIRRYEGWDAESYK